MIKLSHNVDENRKIFFESQNFMVVNDLICFT